ncbi:MAG: FapA family protein, partial [Pseudomonadota bacterium]
MTDPPCETSPRPSDEASAPSKSPASQDAASVFENAEALFDKKDSSGRIIILVASDKLKAFLKLTSFSSEEPYPVKEILNNILNKGITAPVDEKAIADGLATLKKEGDETGFILIAEGKSPVPGKEGECEVLYDQNNPYVEKGQVLIRIKGSTPGSVGKNIFGDPVEPMPNKTPHITPGENVESNDNEFYSNIFGRVSFIHNLLAVHKALEITVDSNAMEAMLTCAGMVNLRPELIKEEIAACKIVNGIDEQAIDALVAAYAAAGDPVKNVIIARGTPVFSGHDGEIKYLFHATKGLDLHEHSEDGVIVMGANVIKSVEKEAEIAHIIPHEEPTPGKDLYGKSIPVQKVKKAKLRAGKNVRMSEDGLHFFAQTGGLPVVEGDKISISDLLKIPGDLNYTVGNIDFDGFVEVNGDVVAGFTVKASKTIIIKGTVGASNLEAGLDIHIEGGCNCQEKSRIVCGGNLEAKYLDEVQVEVRGDILVKNEIIDSRVFCLGRVYLKSGSILGGSIRAKKGIESLDVGNEMGIQTILVPGFDFEFAAECMKIEESIQQKNKEIAELSQRIEPLLKNRELVNKLPGVAKKKVEETIKYLHQLSEDREKLTQCKADLYAQEVKDAVPEVVVHRNLFSGVTLKIGKAKREMRSLHEGPLRIYEENE